MAVAVMSQAPPMITPAAANAINPRRFMVSPSVTLGISAANKQQIACHSAIVCAAGRQGPGSRRAASLSSAQPVENYQTFTCNSNPCDRLPPRRSRHRAASASAPSLRLRKWERLACRGRHAKDVEDHRYQRVVTEDAHELDGRSLAENGTHALERLIADAPRLVELLDEVVDCALVLWGRFRHAPLVQIADRLRFDARALGLGHVGE